MAMQIKLIVVVPFRLIKFFTFFRKLERLRCKLLVRHETYRSPRSKLTSNFAIELSLREIYFVEFVPRSFVRLKALANEDTFLRTHCCRHKCFPVCPRSQHLLFGTQKMLLISFRNILCPQKMFPSLRSPRNIVSNNVSATICPRLPVP